MSLFRSTFLAGNRKRLYPNHWDVIAFFLVLAVMSVLTLNAKQMTTPYELGQVTPISLSPHALPMYAGRTVLRMLIALVFSLLFTFTFATLAAKNKRAEKIIIPLIDVLQSVPILGFLSVTVVGFIHLFPGSMLGPECAAIFAIFTSQAWNMALGFYQTVRSVPTEINEAARMLRLSAWQRFWRIDVSYSMPGLLWNTMASMSAGWFFVVASEAITVSNQQILLPGVGSYIAVAIAQANTHAICYAVIAMFVVILIYDQILFRPLVAWSEKFKAEHVSPDKVTQSWVIDLFRRTRLLRYVGMKITHLFEAMVNMRLFSSVSLLPRGLSLHMAENKYAASLWNALFMLIGAFCLFFLSVYVYRNFSWHETLYVFYLGLVTGFRVMVLIVLCSLIWVPIGVWIGLRPWATRIFQPLAQILAAFPANLFYPFLVIFIVAYHLNPNIWLTPLMILGAQWYILFNVIVGASAVPKELLLVVDNLGVVGWLRWTKLLLPAVFPFYVTGAITAAGGAWNASILAEVASWGGNTLVATGIGAYITQSTNEGDFSHIALGIGIMCFLVLVINRIAWRPLYSYAVSRFILE